MQVIVLASGSKGNAIYIETENSKVLFDVGINLKTIKERLTRQNVNLKELDAIFISHEHTDHTKYIIPVMNKTNAKLFINQLSFDNLTPIIRDKVDLRRVCFMDKERKYLLNDIVVIPIELSHDSKNILGFLIKAENKNIGIITDTGIVSDRYFPLLQKMHIIFLESNHDVNMLLDSSRPWALKQRILSPRGHLSNEECADVLSNIISDNTECVILSHLSEECNEPEIAYDINYQVIAATNIKLLVASEHEEVNVLKELSA